MRIYRGTLELLDYVFYATVERGKVYETGAFVHNYALAYAFGLARAPYAHRRQVPHYAMELAPLNEVGVYLTPAEPMGHGYRLVQWNTIQEGYGLGSKARSIGYPDWGFARVLRPESRFRFYVLVVGSDMGAGAPAFADALAGREARVRLGKFPGKARVVLDPARSVKEDEGAFVAQPLLNWRDFRAEPLVCDVLAGSLPTRLVRNAHFPGGRFYRVRFSEDDDAETVTLPVGMRFLARPPG